MSKSTDQTISFVVRFTQKIFQDDQGEDHVQWRGRISHVQGGDQVNFTEFNTAVEFIQEKLAALTVQATEHRSKEYQEGILQKSFDIWKKMATEGPRMVIEAIRDPKKQVAQIQDQISHVSDEISQKIEIDDWRTASRSDLKKVMSMLEKLSGDVAALNRKVDSIKGPK